LSDLSFSYREAHSHVLAAIRPLLTDMVRKVLPAIAHETLTPILVEQLFPAAERLAGAPIVLTVSPENREPVEAAVTAATAGAPPFPLSVVGDPALGPGQAFLRLGTEEMRVDLDGVIEAISRAVTAFFDQDIRREESRRA
jgi:flagellar assembly protein FliH